MAIVLGAEVIAIFDRCSICGNTLYLPEEQLDRALYMKVDKALKALGGKWTRKIQGHVFENDPTDRFEAMIQTGKVVDPKKTFQFFETPAALVEEMLVLARIQEGDQTLEPSAGKGAIADALKAKGARVICAELNPEMVKGLVMKGYPASPGDFMEMAQHESYDKVVMNPPFSRQQDIDHIMRAFTFLKPGGVLVSVVSEGPFFRQNAKARAFRDWLEENDAVVKKLPEGSFKTSGTGVRTRLVKVAKS